METQTETSIDDLVQQEEQPSQEFDHQQNVPIQMVTEDVMPQNRPVPQSVQRASRLSSIKEFMGQRVDYKSAILVFIISLFLLSGLHAKLANKSTFLWSEEDGQLKLVGIVVLAIAITLGFIGARSFAM
jgi:hypothetical protein